MKAKVIRTLFGDAAGYDRSSVKYTPRGLRYLTLCEEIERSLRDGWSAENVVHLVAGRDNRDLLVGMGAKNVLSLHDAPLRQESAVYGPWWTRVWLMNAAVDLFGEVLCVDFDCCVVRPPDDRMWGLLKRGGLFQACTQWYVSRLHVPVGYFGSRRLAMLNSGAVYCREGWWTRRWLACYGELKAAGYDTAAYNEEFPLFHMVVGLGAKEMARRYEPAVVATLHRSPRWIRKKDDELYFLHGIDPVEV